MRLIVSVAFALFVFLVVALEINGAIKNNNSPNNNFEAHILSLPKTEFQFQNLEGNAFRSMIIDPHWRRSIMSRRHSLIPPQPIPDKNLQPKMLLARRDKAVPGIFLNSSECQLYVDALIQK